MKGKRRLQDVDAALASDLPAGKEASDSEHHTDLSDEDSPMEQLSSSNTKSALDKANKVIRKQKQVIKRLKEQIRRHNKKIALQNKVVNDLMEIYGLKNEDIGVLRTEILKADKPGSP